MLEQHKARVISANIHLTNRCNYDCIFCFSRGIDVSELSVDEWKRILNDMICRREISKINFAGGEPLLYRDLKECIRYTKQLGATTSIVTNGSRVDEKFLEDVSGYLDWIGFSIDSCLEKTEEALGRHSSGHRHLDHIIRISKTARNLGMHIKLNVAVTRPCLCDDFHQIIEDVNPDRVKFMQITKVPGTNSKGWAKTSVTPEEFEDFVKRHSNVLLPFGFRPVFETSEDMIDSYLMIDPLGRVRLGTHGGYVYMPYDTYWNGSMNVNYESYVRRGGIYDWSVQGVRS